MFAEDRYFDVEVEYAKADPEDLVATITVTNRGPAEAALDVLTCIWFRNTWTAARGRTHARAVQGLGPAGSWRTTPNWAAGCCGSTRTPSASSLTTKRTRPGSSAVRIALPYVKDGINDYIVDGRAGRG